MENYQGKTVKSIEANDEHETNEYTITFTDGTSITFHAYTPSYRDDPYIIVYEGKNESVAKS